jgi:mannose-1-phosphate guanylyltransferase/mannose-1-phosphate guanylyltransferase/mannose-6-phosphate isomerase
MAAKIYPVILSGGSGSRLWPLSRESFPKQLLPLAGERSMLQDTAARVADAERFQPLTVVANEAHRFVIAEQLREIGVEDARIVLEPVARNTAPAVAVAALLAAEQDPDALVLVMPADHVILDAASFHRAVAAGEAAARKGALVLFGIEPDSPATGYGYIQSGAPLIDGVSQVARFVEKPPLETAERYLKDGGYLWNSGIFLLPAAAFLADLKQHEPAVHAAAAGAIARAERDLTFLRLEAEAFGASPSISVDHAVMERTTKAAVVAADFAWSDVGAWSALWDIAHKDEAGNVLLGDVIALGARGSYIRSEGPLVATVGLEDIIVVAGPDAVLVAHKGADQDVKQVVDALKARNHPTATQNRRVYRPWGWYEGVHEGDRFQVKRITVKPGEKLSLQKHFHRAEHWVVVNGTALVSVDGEERLLGEDESVYIPLGAVHRLSNPGKVPLNLIEVQSGPYLGEDDIVRFEDIYART